MDYKVILILLTANENCMRHKKFERFFFVLDYGGDRGESFYLDTNSKDIFSWVPYKIF